MNDQGGNKNREWIPRNSVKYLIIELGAQK